ncbi:hypothetical protein D3C80_785790 [compost metagenome]
MLPRLAGLGRQLTHGGELEHQPGVDLQPRLTGPGHHLDRQDRVTAQFEEIVQRADLRHPQHLRPDLAQQGFHRAAQADVLGAGLALRGRQGLAVELAIGAQGHAFERQPVRRHHVLGQLRRQVHLQQRLPVIPLFGQHQPGHQLAGIKQLHADILDQLMLQQPRLDFPQFDAQAAQLDLMVGAPQVLDHPIVPVACQIACAVHALTGVERVRRETLGGQARAAVIAAGQADATEVQLATGAHW